MRRGKYKLYQLCRNGAGKIFTEIIDKERKGIIASLHDDSHEGRYNFSEDKTMRKGKFRRKIVYKKGIQMSGSLAG